MTPRKTPNHLRALSLLLAVPLAAQAEQYGPQEFAVNDGATDFDDGTVLASSDASAGAQIGALLMTEEGTAGTHSSFRIPALAASAQGWTASFEFVLADDPDGQAPGEGFSFSYGAIPSFNADQQDPAAADAHGQAEEGWHPSIAHLAFEFDTRSDDPDEQGFGLSVAGTDLAAESRVLVEDGQLVVGTAILSWNPADGASLSVDLGEGLSSVFANVATPDFTGDDSHVFAFSARNGSASERLLLDTIRVTTIPPGQIILPNPVISEFMADNDSTIEDEDCRSSDWLEIFNATDAAINLEGWYLTDDPANLTRWLVPSLPLAAGAHVVIYASGKDQVTGQLHTDFSLEKDGGFLALVKPDGVTIASSYNYGPQVEDISYGTLGQAQTAGSFSTATPGAKNTGPQGILILDKPLFSLDSQVITEAISVELSTDVPDAVIRYTTNGSTPTERSLLYQSPISISNTTRVTARLFAPGKEPGPVRDRTFVRLNANMLNIRSEVPLIIIDSFGVNIDAFSSANSQNPLRPVHAIFIDRDPSGALATPVDLPDFQGRGGMRVRGQTSSGFAKKQYAFESWDSEGNDKDVRIFGFPSESDWIIHAPYSDKTLMRNKIVYDTSREIGYPASRTRFCELYFNTNGGDVSTSDYRGVYVFMEKIKGSEDRVGIKDLESCDEGSGKVTGGYIFKKDKGQTVDVTFSTARENHQLAFVEPDLPTATQRVWLDRHMDRFESVLHGAGFASPTSGYRAYLDVQSFIDTHIWVELYKNIDGFRLSSYFYKDRGRKITASPVWDYNLSLGNANYLNGENPTGWYWPQLSAGQYPWYRRLFEDPEFELEYWDRYFELRRGILGTTALNTRIAAYEREIARPALRNFNRWRVLGTYLWPNAAGYQQRTSHRSEVAWMRNWLNTRLNWYDSQFAKPPVFDRESGPVNAGDTLAITLPAGASGQIYYTTDGSDPRVRGGGISQSAILYPAPLTLDQSVTVKARIRVSTNRWSALRTDYFLVDGEPASAANLAVTRVHYRPATPTIGEESRGYDLRRDYEYVELLNIATVPVDLAGVTFGDGIEFRFDLGDVHYLLPGERVLVVGNRDAFEFRYGAEPSGIPIAGEFSKDLSNDGETVVLLDAAGEEIRRFTYNDREPWPASSDGTGKSLVLINPTSNPYHDSPLNWRASFDPTGSPGPEEGSTFLGDPEGDVDGNGINDLLQYALAPVGVEPRLPEYRVESFDTPEGPRSFLAITFTRNIAAEDIVFRPEISVDMANWLGVADGEVLVARRVDNGDGTETLTVRSSDPTSEVPASFGRLAIDLFPPRS